MDATRLYEIGILAEEFHNIIAVLIMSSAGYFKAMHSSSIAIISGTILLGIGMMIIKSPIDKLKGAGTSAALYVLLIIGLIPVEAGVYKTEYGTENSDPVIEHVATVDMPLITYIPWRASETISDLLLTSMKSVHDNENRLDDRNSMLTAMTSSANRNVFGSEWPNLQNLYHDYISTCGPMAEKTNININAIPTNGANEVANIEDKHYWMLGLKGGNGIFLDDNWKKKFTTSEGFWEGANISADLHYVKKIRNEALSAFFTEDGVEKGFEKSKKYTYSYLTQSEDGNDFLPEVYDSNVTLVEGKLLNYQNTIEWASYLGNLQAQGKSQDEINDILENFNNSALGRMFYVDNCVDLHNLLRMQIISFKDYLKESMGTYQEIDEGVNYRSEDMEFDPTVAAMVVINYSTASVDSGDNGARSTSYIDRNSPNSRSNFQVGLQNMQSGMQNIVKLWKNWNLQFVMPGVITTFAVALCLLLLLLPLVASLTPLLGSEPLVNILKLMAILYLSGIILWVIFNIGAYFMEEVHVMAHASLLGPGGKTVELLLLQSTAIYIMLAAGAGVIAGAAYMIVNGSADMIAQMKAPKQLSGTQTAAIAGTGVALAAAPVAGAGAATTAAGRRLGSKSMALTGKSVSKHAGRVRSLGSAVRTASRITDKKER